MREFGALITPKLQAAEAEAAGLRVRHDRLKAQVDALGPGFFEELEDLKVALHAALQENRRLRAGR